MEPLADVLSGRCARHDDEAFLVSHELLDDRQHEVICQISIEWLIKENAFSFHQPQTGLNVVEIESMPFVKECKKMRAYNGFGRILARNEIGDVFVFYGRNLSGFDDFIL